MARGRKGNEKKIKEFLAKALKNKNFDVYSSNGKPSPNKLLALLLKETGINVTRQTMSKYLSDDLEPYLSKVDFSQNTKIIEIGEAMTVAKNIYNSVETKPGDKTKALNSWKQLNQQLIDYENHLRELKMRQMEAQKPNYLIQIRAAHAEYTCEKCGTTQYIEYDDEKQCWITYGGEHEKNKKIKELEESNNE